MLKLLTLSLMRSSCLHMFVLCSFSNGRKPLSQFALDGLPISRRCDVTTNGLNCYSDSFLSMFYQHDYKIKDYRVEAVRHDENFVKIWKFSSFKYNRTTTTHNVTLAFKETIGRNLEVVVQGYKFLSNQYRRIQFRFQTNFCKAFDSNVVGMKYGTSHCGNLTECDFSKDTVYHICNFLFDESRFPPLIPTGQYKFSLTAMYLNQDIAEANVYMEIYRPIYPKN